MKYVKQDDGPTCGVACYAMVSGNSFKDAHEKLKPIMNAHGLKTIDLVNAFKSINCKIIGSDRLRSVGKKSWIDLPQLALVKVRPDNCPKRHWHWVIWNGKKIYDPVLGKFLPQQYKYDPISFLEIEYD